MTSHGFRKVLIPVVAVGSLFVLIASSEESGGDKASSSGSESGGGGGSSDESGDVVISTCTTDDLGQLSATLTVTNNSSKASDYFIEVVFESADGSTQLDSTFASVTNLAPGQKTESEAISFEDAPSGSFTCRVVDVMRTASL